MLFEEVLAGISGVMGRFVMCAIDFDLNSEHFFEDNGLRASLNPAKDQNPLPLPCTYQNPLPLPCTYQNPLMCCSFSIVLILSFKIIKLNININ